MRTIYLLKDLARATGYSVYTLEYYLKVGLLREFGRGPDTQYRYFGGEAVKRLKRIRQMRKNGMAIKEIQKSLKATSALLRRSSSTPLLLRD